VTGQLTDAVQTGVLVAGATVLFTPGQISVQSGADGMYTAQLPPGVYAAKITAAGYAEGTLTDIPVIAGQTVTRNLALQPVNPLVANAGAMKWQAGFGATVTLDGSGSSAPAGMTLTYRWRQIGGPTVTLHGADTATPSFTTKTLEELINTGATQFRLPNRFTVLGFTGRDVAEMSYTFELTVSAGPFSKKAQVVVQSVAAHGGLDNVPVNVKTYLTVPAQASYSWTCNRLDGGEVPCAAGVFSGANTRTPAFQPTAEGTYLIREASQASPLTVYAGLFIGSRTAGTDRTRCEACHAREIVLTGRTVPATFAGWATTKHATYFQRAIDGLVSPGYNQTCIQCHTVGYNPDADNGGFDDLMRELGWSFPTTLQAGNYAAMPPRLQSMASIGCEACHGPGSLHASFQSVQSIGKSYNAVDCNQCHQNEPYQVQGIQWARSAHARFTSGFETALAGDPALSGSCTGCHSTQGFVAWTKTGVQNPPAPTADVSEPQTCATCHDPHGLARKPDGSPTPHLLRVWGRVETIVPGVGAEGVGAGALCMTCHNTRRVFAFSGQRAPHSPAQTNVLLGKTAEDFGMGSYGSSPHATVPETCVGCHMAPTPAPGQPGRHEVGGHTFAVKSGSIENLVACTSCHQGLEEFNRTAYADFDGDGVVEGIQHEVEGLMNRLENALADKAAAWWPTQTGCDPSCGAGTKPRVVDFHGRIRILKNYIPGTSNPACNPDVAQEWPDPECFAFTAGNIPLVDPDKATKEHFLRAAWNLFMVRGDGSRGVHNPAFAVEVLQRSYRAVTGSDVPGATIRR
jgi:hypothetical protein